MMRWRTYTDRLIVLAVILAAWQVGSFLVGPYWLSCRGRRAARFCAQIWNGELIRHGGYTVEEALIGTLVGGVPAVLLPFLLRRHPVMVAILDPFMVGGYGAPKLAFAPLFILWFGIGIESKIALVAGVVFFIVYFNALSGAARARSPARPDGTDRRRRRAARSAARGSAGGGAAHSRRLRIAVPYAIGGAIIAELISSNRGLGYLVQTGAMNFDTTSVFSAILAATLIARGQLAAQRRRATLLRWRPPAQAMLDAEN